MFRARFRRRETGVQRRRAHELTFKLRSVGCVDQVRRAATVFRCAVKFDVDVGSFQRQTRPPPLAVKLVIVADGAIETTTTIA